MEQAERPRGRRWLVPAAAGLAVVAVGATTWSGLASGRREAEARRDEKSFDVARADVAAPPSALLRPDGGQLQIGDLRGQVLFVNFWATWCPPCTDEMPSMLQLGRDLSRDYPGRFRMVAVSVDDHWDEVLQFFRGKLPPDALVLRDPDLAATRAFYCAARGGCPDSFKFPETYVVDPKGRLVAYMVGPRDWSNPSARRVLERILDR